MLVNKIIKIILLLLGGTYIVLEGFTLEYEGAAVSAIMLVLLTFLYIVWTKHKSSFFFWFLITFTIAQILSYLAWHGPEVYIGEIDYFYYIANTLYVIAYIILIIKTFRSLDLKAVFSQLTVPIIILVVLDVFCVSIINETTQHALTNYQYALEYTYNAVVMTLLSFALINYMYRNNYKSMLFLLGSIFIVFSEIIQLAYFYILNDQNLGFVYSFFLVVAFIFLYKQSQIQVSDPVPAYTDEQLKA